MQVDDFERQMMGTDAGACGKRKYAIFTARFNPLVGGVEKFSENLAKELAEEGEGVTVVTSAIGEQQRLRKCDRHSKLQRAHCIPIIKAERVGKPMSDRALTTPKTKSNHTSTSGFDLALWITLSISSFICSWVLTLYLKVEPAPLYRIALFAIGLLALRKLSKQCVLKRIEIFIWAAFSALIAISIVLGYHISIGGNPYSGHADVNFITPYHLSDIIAFACITAFLSVLFAALFSILKDSSIETNCPFLNLTPEISKLRKRAIVIGAHVLFACYIPYLLIYFPGFVFGDTLGSISQINGNSYSNHHPFFYTMLLRACFNVSSLFGAGITGGCVIYCIVQMAAMAFCFSYLAEWTTTRCNLGSIWHAGTLIIFALTPYVATYSIAMWKDPLFSCAIIVMSLNLADFALSRAKIAHSKTWSFSLVCSSILAGLLRSNGIVCIAVALALLLICLLRRLSNGDLRLAKPIGKASLLTTIALSLCLVITGPVYNALGVSPTPKAESIGIPLNQMARVVALDGEMTESDREFMNNLLPIDMYATTYTPMCVDKLKWNPHFNNSSLNDSSLANHWLSMFFKNPVIFFEAWELQTCGFWVINLPEAYQFTNIAGGVPRNTVEEYSSELDTVGITYGNVLNNDELSDIFVQDEPSVPISFLTWGILWLALCFMLLARRWFIIALAPSFGISIVLLIASPIWYWPRYGAAEQFLIPFFFALFLMSIVKRTSHNSDST